MKGKDVNKELSNDMTIEPYFINLDDLVKSIDLVNTKEFNDYINQKYGSLQAAQDGDKTYYTIDGIQVDLTTYNTLLPEKRGEIRTSYDEEVLINESKRRIKIVRRGFINGLTNTIRTLFNVQ